MRMPAFEGPAPVCYSSITSTVAALREVSQQNRGYRSKMLQLWNFRVCLFFIIVGYSLFSLSYFTPALSISLIGMHAEGPGWEI